MAQQLIALNVLEEEGQFSAPTGQLTTFSHSSPEGSDALFWLSWALHAHDAQMPYSLLGFCLDYISNRVWSENGTSSYPFLPQVSSCHAVL